MELELVLDWVNKQLFAATGEHLTELQRVILQQVWLGKTYGAIARSYGCTEGHAKDVGSILWKQLTKLLNQRVSKQNVRPLLERYFQQTDWSNAQYPTTRLNAPPTSSEESPNFVGRTGAIAHLNRLVNGGAQVIVIQGEGGLGKTTLAQTYLHQGGFDLILELLMAKEASHISPVERVVEEWFSKDLGEDPSQEFGVTLARLKRYLQQRRVGILIDNLEPALDRDGRLIPPHRPYLELLRVLGEHHGASLTLITSRDRLCESSLTVEHYRLPRLDLNAWTRFFHHRDIHPTVATLQAAHHTYGGNAKAMGLLYGAVQEDFEGDLDAYWQEHSSDPLVVMDLKNLVSQQFNRLQHLDADAYRLLCRLGCYRYQSVATVPTNGLLHLLWDVPTRQKQVIMSLRNRSLIESTKGRYWLHPVIRAEAIARLRQQHQGQQDEWRLTHERAAEFWTNAVTQINALRDALAAWEAHYHYLEIQDFEATSQVILHSRHNQWGQFLPLGSTLYRMGLLQPVLKTVACILPHVQSERHISELQNILGDLLWITGNVEQAISCQQKAMAIAHSALQQLPCEPNSSPTSGIPHTHEYYTFRMIAVDSLLSLGLYHIDLWDLSQAKTYFEEVIQLADQTPHQAWATKAKVCLALVFSLKEEHADASALANPIYTELSHSSTPENTARFSYFIQILAQTYGQMGELTRAATLYQQVIHYAELSHYTQVKARAIHGMALLDRIQGQWQQARANHEEAIALLETIGATCDLAEAHFQYGLTLNQLTSNSQTPEPTQEAHQHFQTAIHLFSSMAAPLQIARIQRQVFSSQKSEVSIELDSGS